MIEISSLDNQELVELQSRITHMLSVKAVIPNFNKNVSIVTHTDDDINSMSCYDEHDYVNYIDLANVKATPVFLSRCSYYFNNQFPYLSSINLTGIKDVDSIISIIFDKKHINNFPALKIIQVDEMCDNCIPYIYDHFKEYKYIIREKCEQTTRNVDYNLIILSDKIDNTKSFDLSPTTHKVVIINRDLTLYESSLFDIKIKNLI